MDTLFIIGGLFLAWAFGRNNISNAFGAAVFTRMVSMRTATVIGIVFVILGAIISGDGTSASMLKLGSPKTMLDAFMITVSAGLVLWIMTYQGIPISIAQAMVGSVVGFSLALQSLSQYDVLIKTVSAWLYSPFLATGVAFLIFKLMRILLRHYSVSLLKKDILTRFGLIMVGAFSAYALGANNVTGISAPFLTATDWGSIWVNLLICAFVGLGFFTADKKVMRTMGSGLFPLSPLEALIVVFSGGLTLFLFSWGGLKGILTYYGLPSFPLVPVPMTSAIIGSIVGVSVAKGGYGLKYAMLGKVVVSWVLTPILSGLICFGLMTIWLLTGKM